MNKLLLISIILAVFIIGGAVFFVMSGGDNAGGRSYANSMLTAEGSVDLPLAYRLCAPGDSCIVVDRHCGYCCDYIAINARYEGDFDEFFGESCTAFKGRSCDCSDLTSYPSCVDNQCRMIPFPDL